MGGEIGLRLHCPYNIWLALGVFVSCFLLGFVVLRSSLALHAQTICITGIRYLVCHCLPFCPYPHYPPPPPMSTFIPPPPLPPPSPAPPPPFTRAAIYRYFCYPPPVKSERRYFSPFSLCGYSFSLIADPGGNPRAANQAQAAGAPRVEKGLSVYLTVEFQNGLPDTLLWGGGFLSHPAFPPPPLQVGPGHPWLLAGEGSTTGGGGNNSVDEGSGGGGGCVEGEVLVAGRAEGREVKRDPHGLRRRRRRCRTREGRTKMVSHVRDPSVIERGCCAAFSLSAVNEAGLKDVMWVSSMDDDRFFPGRSSWGVHCLLPTSRIQVCVCFGGKIGGGTIVGAVAG